MRGQPVGRRSRPLEVERRQFGRRCSRGEGSCQKHQGRGVSRGPHARRRRFRATTPRSDAAPITSRAVVVGSGTAACSKVDAVRLRGHAEARVGPHRFQHVARGIRPDRRIRDSRIERPTAIVRDVATDCRVWIRRRMVSPPRCSSIMWAQSRKEPRSQSHNWRLVERGTNFPPSEIYQWASAGCKPRGATRPGAIDSRPCRHFRRENLVPGSAGCSRR